MARGRIATVRVNVYAHPGVLAEKVEKINANLEAAGWNIQGFGVGETSGIVPRTIPVRWDLYYRDGKSAKVALIKASEPVRSFFEAWENWSESVTNDVIIPTAKDTATIVKKAVPQFALGAGVVLGLVAVIAGAYVYVRYARK